MTTPPKSRRDRKAHYEALQRIEECLKEGGDSLSLSNLELREIPQEIAQLAHLKVLSLRNNRLTTLCSEIGNLLALKTLDLSQNSLTTLPIEFGRLTALTELHLDGNRFAALPRSIGGLVNLKKLHLQNCPTKMLPPEIGRLSKLEELWLQSNELECLPPEIRELTELRVLFLNNNRLVDLPEQIGSLKKLESLQVWNNHLASLPSEVGLLAALDDFDLHDNRLVTIPSEIGQLTKMTRLSLQNNLITSLPAEIIRLEKLTTLFLHDNIDLGLPPEVMGPSWDEYYSNDLTPASPRAILDYYFAREEQGEAPMKEVRLLLVGRGRAGKTSLLKVLRGEQPDKFEQETPGITVLPLELECSRGIARAHAWDFGGQEFLHGTHQIFLSERCAYLLVLEGRDSNWELETDYWLRFIQSYGGDSPVLVALNKYDAHAFSVDRYRLQERCPQIVGFVETDTFTGRGIGELRNLLTDTVNGMDHVWAGVPKKWHRVKEKLTRMRKSFLEYKDFQSVCARLGVAEDLPQASLAETLHRLGIALNFRDHHRLRETSVLKPQWVTEGIYGLLRFSQRKDCHGVLEWAWIGEALSAKEYPAKKHRFVMELMEKFEVAFALEARGGGVGSSKQSQRWLIPELLPEEQPAPFSEFRDLNVRRLRFTYPQALPPGLLPRLIVRTHEMSEAHPDWRWRTGVVLEWNGAQALVRLDRNERRTEVAVIGTTDKERQALFDIIRAHLTVLHGKVPVIEEVQALDEPAKWIEMREVRMAEREKDMAIKVAVSDDPKVPRVKLQVTKTRRRVESDAAARAAGPDAEPRLQLFISYAHANEKEIIPFRQHLTHLSQQGYIQVWHDRDLVPGERWEAGIVDALNRADIVLLFYTTAARISKFIQQTELTLALERSDSKMCTLLWVPLERNDLDLNHPLEKRLSMLQCATRDAKPIYDFEIVPKGWLEVEQAIRKAVAVRRANFK